VSYLNKGRSGPKGCTACPASRIATPAHEIRAGLPEWLSLPAQTKGWQGQCAYIDAAHRVHTRVEDVIRTGKDTGHFPSRDHQVNQA
jgi:hypothetical protein